MVFYYVARVLRSAGFAAAILFSVAPGDTRAGDAGTAAAPSTDLIDDALLDHLRSAIQVPAATISVAAQNVRTAELSQSEVNALDRMWREQRDTDDQPVVAELLGNPLSSYLLYIQAASVGLITEIIVMDARGLNVGQSALTSDYWQGDEKKFKSTVPKGASAVFIDEAFFHEGTGTWRCQASLTLTGPDGTVIGAATFEINLNELARRRALKS